MQRGWHRNTTTRRRDVADRRKRHMDAMSGVRLAPCSMAELPGLGVVALSLKLNVGSEAASVTAQGLSSTQQEHMRCRPDSVET